MGSSLGCTSRGLRAGCTGRFSPNPNHEWLTQTAMGVCPTFIAVLVSIYGANPCTAGRPSASSLRFGTGALDSVLGVENSGQSFAA